MKFFVDTADTKEIHELNDLGLGQDRPEDRLIRHDLGRRAGPAGAARRHRDRRSLFRL